MTTCARLAQNVRPLGGLVGRGAALVALGLLPLVAGCTKAQQQGTGSSYLIVDSIEGASGAKPDEFGVHARPSDVISVKGKSVCADDLGDRWSMHLGLKDPGSSDSPTSPTSANFITVSRYHVEYVRADGRNTPGVDVPFPFDGAMTLTVGAGNATGSFDAGARPGQARGAADGAARGRRPGRDLDDRARSRSTASISRATT